MPQTTTPSEPRSPRLSTRSATTATVRPLGLAFALLACACADGGSKETTAGEVQLNANHHVWTLSALQTFTAFPVAEAEVLPLSGTFLLNVDETYSINLSATNAGTDGYAISNAGLMSVFVSQGSRRPRIRYAGGYGLEGNTGLFFFTDRFASSSTGSVGLFWGTRVATATPTLQGDWHAFSLHVIYAATTALIESGNVGRAVGGSIAIDGAGMITGTGTESTNAAITWTGMASAFGDGTVTMAPLNFQDPQTTDPRNFVGSATTNVVLALDGDETPGENGLLALVRKFPMATTADPNLLSGDYHVGGWTVFVDPARRGSDAATGTLKFNAMSGFTLDATGSQGIPFTYSGSYALMADGSMNLTVGSQSWKAAVDENYDTVVILDNTVEVPTGTNVPELNIFLGLRVVATTP